jgi:hypothetical protein
MTTIDLMIDIMIKMDESTMILFSGVCENEEFNEIFEQCILNISFNIRPTKQYVRSKLRNINDYSKMLIYFYEILVYRYTKFYYVGPIYGSKNCLQCIIDRIRRKTELIDLIEIGSILILNDFNEYRTLNYAHNYLCISKLQSDEEDSEIEWMTDLNDKLILDRRLTFSANNLLCDI